MEPVRLLLGRPLLHATPSFDREKLKDEQRTKRQDKRARLQLFILQPPSRATSSGSSAVRLDPPQTDLPRRNTCALRAHLS